MFKFDFDLESEEAEAGPSRPSLPPPRHSNSRRVAQDLVRPSFSVSVDELLNTLPSTISYSPLPHPDLEPPLLRRDLYDARFQLASAGSATEEPEQGVVQKGVGGGGEAEYVNAETDLISGVYEGGLKTWEGGLDLVDVLGEMGEMGELVKWVRGTRVLEVGCGTAMPTAFLLRALLASPSDGLTTTLHVQDYNLSVLSLVTLPNLLLAALPFLPADSLRPAEDAGDVEDVLPDEEKDGTLHITLEVKDAFRMILKDSGVALSFTYGDWSGFAEDLERGEGYGLVMTAETIYSERSVESLIDVLRAASVKKGKHGGEAVDGAKQGEVAQEIRLEDSLGDLGIGDKWKQTPLSEQEDAVVLVAAKVLYFGVGGGLQSFLDRVEGDGGWYEGVKDWTKGVGRKVVKIGWG